MTDINYRAVIVYVIIGLILAAGLAVAFAHAEPITSNSNLTIIVNGSYALVDTPYGPVNISSASSIITNNTSSRYIYQGETVYLGDTLDISGVVAPYPQLAYWDGYDQYDSLPTYNISLPQQKSGWYKFVIDPVIFSGRIGKWYKYDSRFERAGNGLAFIISPRPFYNYTMTFQNGTMIYVSELPEFVRSPPMKTPIIELMPRKPVADYLVTPDASLNISISKLSAVWIFNGHDNSIQYSVNNTPQITFSKHQIRHLEPGDYKLIIQTVGNVSTDLDVIYTNDSIKWFDRSVFEVKTISTGNLVPTEAIRTLETIFPLTYDTYQIKTLTVQDPAITINYMNRVSVGSAKEYYRDSDMRGNVSLMDVRGYTNVFPGTNVSVVLDEETNNPREISKLYTYRSLSQGSYLGDMRYYQVYVPLYWDSLKPGMHSLTARTELGGATVANFPVDEETPDSYIPPQTIRFMGDRNPWVPNLTVPEPVVVVQTKVVEKVIRQDILPSDDQISAAAQKIVDEQNRRNEMLVVIGIIGLFVLAVFGWVGYSLWRARR